MAKLFKIVQLREVSEYVYAESIEEADKGRYIHLETLSHSMGEKHIEEVEDSDPNE